MLWKSASSTLFRTLCLQPKLTSDTSEAFFFFFFTFFLFSSRTQRTYLPDEGGPGILLLSLWRKKTIKPDMQRFNHFNIPPCSFFNQPTVSVIYFISEEIPCCAISLIFTWSCYVDVDFGWTFWFIFLMIFSWFLFF